MELGQFSCNQGILHAASKGTYSMELVPSQLTLLSLGYFYRTETLADLLSTSDLKPTNTFHCTRAKQRLQTHKRIL